ncbi:hypothetical protein Gotur_005597 [Gossypium turneri]
MRNCKSVWEIATEREWTNFCLPPEEPTVIPVVQRFYLTLKEREATMPFYEMRTFVKVRGVNILVIGRSIYQFYDAPYYYCDYLYKTSLKEFKNVDMEEIFRFLTEGKEVWTYQPGTTIPKMFNQALMTPKAKLWMKFVCPRIWPTYDLVDISLIQAILVSKKGTFFLHPITESCKRAGVPIEQLDKEMNPSKKLLGDDVYKKYIIPQRKQKEQRRKRGF